MNEELIGAVITLEDDKGNETDFVIADIAEHEGTAYLALEEADLGPDEMCELLIMKFAQDGSDELLMVDAFEDKEEYDTMFQIFCDRQAEEE